MGAQIYVGVEFMGERSICVGVLCKVSVCVGVVFVCMIFCVRYLCEGYFCGGICVRSVCGGSIYVLDSICMEVLQGIIGWQGQYQYVMLFMCVGIYIGGDKKLNLIDFLDILYCCLRSCFIVLDFVDQVVLVSKFQIFVFLCFQ